MGGVREVKVHLIEILLQPRTLYKKKGHKRDICPFLPTLHWARIKYCGRTQGGSKVTVVTLCGCPGHYRQKRDIKGTYVPFCQPCTGQELNIVGGVREVQMSLL